MCLLLLNLENGCEASAKQVSTSLVVDEMVCIDTCLIIESRFHLEL